MNDGYELTRPYTLTCPECGGALFPPSHDPMLSYSCHIGHRLGWDSLMDAQLDRIEAALGTAMVVLKERAELCRHLAASREIDPQVLERMQEEADLRARLVKELLESGWTPAKPAAGP